MKQIVVALLMICVTSVANSQIVDPVSLDFKAVKKTANTYEVIVAVTVEAPWHIYSMKTGAGGPIPNKIIFDKNPLLKLSGNVKETGKVKKSYDNIFKTNVAVVEGTVKYTQLVAVKGNVKTNISGSFEYMACDDKQCLPPSKKQFNIKLQ